MNEILNLKEGIVNELQKSHPSKKKMVVDLFKNQKLPYTKMIETVEDIFQLQPENYMEHLYKIVRKKIRKVYGRETLKEMEKNIIENHCLQEGEQILLEFDGAVQLFENPTLKSRGVNTIGSVFVTNKRIFVQGSIVALNGSFSSGFPARKKIITKSRQNRCYGYIFPIILNLKIVRINTILSYSVLNQSTTKLRSVYYTGDTIEKKAISLNTIYHIIIKTMTVLDEIAPNHFTPLGIPKSSFLRWIIARTPATK
ncbi:MAG: hypothetical protein P8Y23_02780 [Candidatus Lokiarchaeota archaeon]